MEMQRNQMLWRTSLAPQGEAAAAEPRRQPTFLLPIRLPLLSILGLMGPAQPILLVSLPDKLLHSPAE